VELLSDGQRRKATTDADGRYRFADVTAGPAHLTASHPDFATAERDLVIASTGRADRPFDVDDVDLSEPGSIEGRVVDADGRPVPGARVRAGTAGTLLPASTSDPGTAVTDGDGVFRLERVPSGNVEVRALSTRAGRGQARVDVEAGRTTSDVVVKMLSAAQEEGLGATGGVAITLAGTAAGIAVVEISPGSEAERAGLIVGDRLERVDAARPSSIDDAKRLLAGPDGTDVVVEVQRSGQHVALRVRREPVRR
jgi:hypothetical protein